MTILENMAMAEIKGKAYNLERVSTKREEATASCSVR